MAFNSEPFPPAPETVWTATEVEREQDRPTRGRVLAFLRRVLKNTLSFRLQLKRFLLELVLVKEGNA